MKSSALLLFGILLVSTAVIDAGVIAHTRRQKNFQWYFFSLVLALLACFAPTFAGFAVRYISADAYRSMVDVLSICCAMATVLGAAAGMRMRTALRPALVSAAGMFLVL